MNFPTTRATIVSQHSFRFTIAVKGFQAAPAKQGLRFTLLRQRQHRLTGDSCKCKHHPVSSALHRVRCGCGLACSGSLATFGRLTNWNVCGGAWDSRANGKQRLKFCSQLALGLVMCSFPLGGVGESVVYKNSFQSSRVQRAYECGCAFSHCSPADMGQCEAYRRQTSGLGAWKGTIVLHPRRRSSFQAKIHH